MAKIIVKFLVITHLCLFITPCIFAQVDETQTHSDTLYIYDEEIIYDTLYIQGSPSDSLLTKDALLEAFQKSGIGQIYYDKGSYWLTGIDEVYKLNNSDLQMLFTPAQYEIYLKSKRNQYISIPLYAAGGSAAAIAGIGAYQFFSSVILMAQAGSRFIDNDNIIVDIWKNAMRGVFLVGGGLLVASACIVPAVVLTIKSKVQLNGIANDFNQPSTSLRLSLGATPNGVGVILSF